MFDVNVRYTDGTIYQLSKRDTRDERISLQMRMDMDCNKDTRIRTNRY